MTEAPVSGVTNCLGLPKIEEFLRKLALLSAKTGKSPGKLGCLVTQETEQDENVRCALAFRYR